MNKIWNLATWISGLVCMVVLMMLPAGCNDDKDTDWPVVLDMSLPEERDPLFDTIPAGNPHKDKSLKILAIGNSFTVNATTFLPWLVAVNNSDSVCVARMYHSGCSLKMHWDYHCSREAEYYFQYSSGGKWDIIGEMVSFDRGLTMLDWDVIVIQQVSGDSGRYSTYEPYLNCLLRLFRIAHPNVKIAWHYTWAYREGADHPSFKHYGQDSQKMYEDIMKAGDRASQHVDYRILSATLLQKMRKVYPEVEDGFAEDGYHISDSRAKFALGLLWYECLIAPVTLHSSLEDPAVPGGINPDEMTRAYQVLHEMGY
ncbi:MAG: DUF4886 domain-containing protein [Muribaculaceae bacterium]|nr:DUF4886 domain-containing protein [Muribaculaceae bacterium]